MKYMSTVLLVLGFVTFGAHVLFRDTSYEDKNAMLIWVSVVCLVLYFRSRIIDERHNDNIPVIGSPNWMVIFNVVLFIYISKIIEKIKIIGINSATLSIICLVLILIIGSLMKFKQNKV
jgi:hypothetical protein